MIWNLLDGSASAGVSEAAATGGNNYMMIIMLIAIAVLMVVYFLFSNRRRKKQEAEINEMMSALKPGDKILTIGRWRAEIVEVTEDGLFVVKTGSDEHPGYLTIEKEAIAHIFKQEENAENLPDELPPAEGEQQENEPSDDVFQEEANVDGGEENHEESAGEIPTFGPTSD